MSHVVPQCFSKRLIRHPEILVTPTVEDGCPSGVNRTAEFTHQPGLSDAGLAPDENRATRALSRLLPDAVQHAQLLFAPDASDSTLRGAQRRRYRNVFFSWRSDRLFFRQPTPTIDLRLAKHDGPFQPDQLVGWLQAKFLSELVS